MPLSSNAPSTAAVFVDPSKLRKGQTVQYQNCETNEPVVATVTGRAGKSSGKMNTWYNIKCKSPSLLEGEEFSVDLHVGQVANLQLLTVDSCENSTENVLMVDVSLWDEAKSRELESWKHNSVYTVCPDTGQKCISTRWVCSMKECPSRLVPKARLVARGFEECDLDTIPKDSPTCYKESLRAILAIFAQNKWQPQSIDVKTAFLQGKHIEREVYIRPPHEANCPQHVWKLNKCVYGLSDASLYWYDSVKSVLLETGAKMSKIDPAVFYYMTKEGVLEGVIACHVDDFIWGGTNVFEQIVIDVIRNKFQIGKENSAAFQYVGIQLCSTDSGITLNQNSYASSFSPIRIEKSCSQQKESDLSDMERQTLRSKVGQILWIGHQSRPDIMFDALTWLPKLKMPE